MDVPLSTAADQQTVQPLDIDQLRVQQHALSQQGRLHWVHWLIIGLTVFITLFAWKTSASALEKQERSRFDREAERVVNQLRDRISHYEDALLSGVAAMHANEGSMSRSQWQRFASYLELNERYPGTNGIGVIHYVRKQNIPEFLSKVRIESPGFDIHPKHTFNLTLPITYIEPEEVNAAALGLDVAFEYHRRSAALYARYSGQTQISGPIVLVQDDDKTPGFLFYAPYYTHQETPVSSWTAEQRERHFKGLIYAPLVVKNLVEGVLSAQNRSVTLSIWDGNAILYDESDGQFSNKYTTSEEVKLHGRVWVIDIASKPSLTAEKGVDQPIIVLVSGLSLDAMLLGLFWLMSRTNRRTLSMAESMTDTLVKQAQKLSENNRDLESFAHVVSHDLKTPIRNISSVVGIIDEDHGRYLASNDEGLEIKRHLDTLHDQSARGQNLINGILAYSRIGANAGDVETVDTRELVESIGRQFNLSTDQLRLSGSFPSLLTNVTLLEQVLSNLIGNAIKYNPQGDSATVVVTAAKTGTHHQFAVCDNGPGIESRFHDRIFETFTTVNVNSNIHSSGIGLSIVKRALEIQGGSISVESAPGKGATFKFTWPDQQTPVNSEKRIRYG